MEVASLFNLIGADFYTGVPDSQLKALCDFLMHQYGINKTNHIIAANEGNCVALAAGYHLATGKVPVIYMQNSGEGNIINPVASLLNDQVYALPAIFIIGWRGEPNIHDEPQHVFQGKVTLKLLEAMDINYFIITSQTSEAELAAKLAEFKPLLSKGKQVALVVKKGALTCSESVKYQNNSTMQREAIIEHIVKVAAEDPIISTTGKASRELFEIRERNHQSHKYDFLTVGSMGHSSSIALGIALNKPHQKIWCLDGDGAALMHLGAMAVIGANKPQNLIHCIINNCAHETVGGMPTVAGSIDFCQIAKGCGYEYVASVDNPRDLDRELKIIKNRHQLSLLDIKCAIGARKDLGRPTTTPIENKNNFIQYLNCFS